MPLRTGGRLTAHQLLKLRHTAGHASSSRPSLLVGAQPRSCSATVAGSRQQHMRHSAAVPDRCRAVLPAPCAADQRTADQAAVQVVRHHLLVAGEPAGQRRCQQASGRCHSSAHGLQQIEKSSRQGGGAGRRRRRPNPSPERAVSGGDHHGAAGGLRGGAMGSSGEAGGWCVGVLAPPRPAPAPWRACSAPHSPRGGPRRCSAGCGP